ncbi:MAG: SRPBCC family protein [Paucibacter sp.]|nr:SRPBCC family protein [Roseateles sp.]
MTDTPCSDRIERSVLLQASRARVWQALTNAEEFGEWFGVKLQGQAFVPGRRNRAQLSIKGYEHVWLEMLVERIEPQTTMAYRWHPFAIDMSVDYSVEEPTLVTFTLEDAVAGQTRLTVVESGFDRVPAHRRLEAWRMNSAGWEGQLRNITKHLHG